MSRGDSTFVVFMVLLVSVVVLVASACTPGVGHRSPAGSIDGLAVAMRSSPYEVEVFATSGRRIARYGPDRPWKDGEREVYLSAAANPPRNMFAVARCRAHTSDFRPFDCVVLLVEVEGLRESVLFEAEKGAIVDRLAWTADGTALVFVHDADLISVDARDGRIRWRVPSELSGIAPPPDTVRPRTRVSRLLPNGPHPMVVRAGRAAEDQGIDSWVGRLDGDTGAIEWVCFTTSYLRRRTVMPTCSDEDIPDILSVDTDRWPWSYGVVGVSLDGRLQYYAVRDEGWFSSRWLMVHDRETGERRRVRRIDWSLYSK